MVVGITAPAAHAGVPPASRTVTVSGNALGALTLSPLRVDPPFSSGIHDYAARCGSGGNFATLRLSAPSGHTIQYQGSTAASFDIPVTLWENEPLVVRATDPAAASGPPTEYWIRCLPRDFPAIEVTDPGTAPVGWYLTGINTPATNGAPSGSYAMILNEHGTPVWYRSAPTAATNTTLLPGNVIAYAPNLGPGFGTKPTGAYTLFDLDTHAVGSLPAPIQPTDPHELLQLPNGHRMLIGTPIRSGYDLSVLGSAFASTHAIVDCLVEEVDAEGRARLAVAHE